MATARTSPVDPPSVEQLAAKRAIRFHQDGNALLTLESVRAWMTSTGLALYLPRPGQLVAPAPSFVEAVLGTNTPEPTQDQLQQARNMLTRLIAEGTCVPLNLLGASGGSGTDVPDYVCSPMVFSFLFTLRGNKAWKTAPVTNGPVKVSPLALNAYEMVDRKVMMSSYDLTTQLGKEVTEAAVLRGLTELWQQLRVLPVLQADGSATLWELSTSRFTKQIKAGANAGQPTALSALISLYLNQVIAATEEDVETFLSPLASRSRLRSVLHDLIGARQLETIVVEGKTLVHIVGDLPSFADDRKITNQPAVEKQGAEDEDGESGVVEGIEGSRIRKFTPGPAAKLATGLRARPAFGSKPAFARKPGLGAKSAYGRPAGDRERSSFSRATRPTFNRPWDEDRTNLHEAKGAFESVGEVNGVAEQTEAPARPAFRTQRPFGTKPTFGSRAGSAKPAFKDNPAYRDRPERPRRDFSSGDFHRPGGFGVRPSRPFSGGNVTSSPRNGDEGRNDAAPPQAFSKPGTLGRKREGGSERGDSRPPRRNFASSESRPPRREFGPMETRPQRPNFASGEGHPRREFNSANGRPPRREFNPGSPASTGFKRPGNFSGSRPERNAGGAREGFSGTRPEQAGSFSSRKPFAPRTGNDRPAFSERPAFGGRTTSGNNARPGQRTNSTRLDSAGEVSRKPFRKFDAPQGPKSFGGRSSGAKQASKYPRSSFKAQDARSSFAAKGGPFAKFADGKKPFRKPGKPAGGSGFTPTRRKRPEDEA